jgi:tripartite-type tricarboxylate transporter receptor subunit TctC
VQQIVDTLRSRNNFNGIRGRRKKMEDTKKRVTYLGITLVLAVLTLCWSVPSPMAKDFPEHDITYIVSYAVGGKADLMARALVPYAQERLGVGVRIENVPGVVRIGLNRLWKSNPDGYTVGGLSLPAPMITELTSQTDYRSREFTPLYAWNASNAVLQVHKDGPKTITEFLQSAKNKTLTCAIGAFGTGAHLVGILMARGLGIDLRWVHYNSGGEASTALAGGHVDCGVVAVTPQIVSLVKGGKLRSLLVVADEKDPAFPDVPIQKEEGFPFRSMAFIEGVAAPKNLPPAQLQRLENAFSEAAKDPRFLKWADETKTQVISLSSKAFGQKIAEYYQEVDNYKAFLKQ